MMTREEVFYRARAELPSGEEVTPAKIERMLKRIQAKARRQYRRRRGPRRKTPVEVIDRMIRLPVESPGRGEYTAALIVARERNETQAKLKSVAERYVRAYRLATARLSCLPSVE
jgi:hypothetical protein